MDPRLIQEASVLLKNISPVISKEVVPRLTNKFGPVIAKKVGLPIAKKVGLPIARRVGIPIARKTGYFLMQKAGYPLINKIIGPESAALLGLTDSTLKSSPASDSLTPASSIPSGKSFFRIPKLLPRLRKKKTFPSSNPKQQSPNNTFKPTGLNLGPLITNHNSNRTNTISKPLSKPLSESLNNPSKPRLPSNNYVQQNNSEYYFGNTNPFNKGSQRFSSFYGGNISPDNR
jgi:hypothetical protein